MEDEPYYYSSTEKRKKKHEKYIEDQMEKLNSSRALPQTIIALPNPDKHDEKWTKGRDPLDLPCPTRVIISAPPNTGKSTIILNMILRSKPEYKKIWVAHCSELTKEYDILKNDDDKFHDEDKVDVTISDVLPPMSWFEEKGGDKNNDRKTKKLVILDDINYKTIDKKGAKKDAVSLDRLFGFYSSHMFCSVIATAQNFYNLDPAIKRMCNLLIIGKINDALCMKSMAQKIGFHFEVFEKYLKLLEHDHDTLWFDMTKKTPYPIRLNGYELYEKL